MKKIKEKPQRQTKKINSKKVYDIALKLLVSIFVCLCLAIVPTLCISLSTVEDKLSKASNHKGILELWNIDSFEGGIASKTAYLTNRSIAYEKQNKGLYIMVKNYTEAECLNALEDGQRPALISFGAGVGSKLINYLSEIKGNYSRVKSQFLSAGKVGKTQFAVPWCSGMYSLISSAELIEKSGQNLSGGLAPIAGLCGSERALKNGKKVITYSVAFGGSGYTNSLGAFSAEFGKITSSPTAYNPDYTSKTPYGAYCDFVEGKANILLGTQRDVARIENRYTQGKIDNVVYQHLSQYTDLVQFIGIVNTTDTDIYNSANNFINYLLLPENQAVLAKIGMYSVTGEILYTSGEWAKSQAAFNKITKVLNAFTTTEQIEQNKKQSV